MNGIQIFNIQGAQVDFDIINFNTDLNISVLNLEAGIYFVHITIDNEALILKLIKE